MEKSVREQLAEFVYTYQQELPLKRIINGDHFSIQELKHLDSETLSKYCTYIRKRLNIIDSIKKDQDLKKAREERDISDSLEEYLVYTHEEDNGIDEEPTRYEENFLGAKGPNERRF